MAKIITQLNIPIPQKLDALTEKGFMDYYFWQRDSGELDKRIVGEFKDGILSRVPYSDSNRPDAEAKTQVPAGPFIFEVTTSLTTKRPSYSKVNQELGKYLAFLADQYHKDIRREGVLTLEGQPFVAVADLQAKITECLSSLLDGKCGVANEVELLAPQGEIAVPDRISVVIGRDYSALSESNARSYLEAQVALKEGNAQSNAFKALVLQDSLATVDETKESLKDVVALAYAFGNFTFVNQLEPRTAPKHKDILEAFTKPAPEKIRSNSKMGDLVLAELMGDDSMRPVLEEKKLLSLDFMVDYAPKKRDGGMYVRLEGVSSALQRYMQSKVTRTIEQNLSLRPTERM